MPQHRRRLVEVPCAAQLGDRVPTLANHAAGGPPSIAIAAIEAQITCRVAGHNVGLVVTVEVAGEKTDVILFQPQPTVVCTKVSAASAAQDELTGGLACQAVVAVTAEVGSREDGA